MNTSQLVMTGMKMAEVMAKTRTRRKRTLHQNQLPAHVYRSVAEDVCPKDVKEAGTEKGNDYRGNKQLSTAAFQHQPSNSKEIGIGLSTWGFQHIREKAG